ncbi:MAG: UPF0164 family protein [Treponema sp.]|nr:UPF0164 family protein [Treponema sp.]MBR0486597.1 UPF0164 family protein [Treponema sp.]
MEIHFSAVRKNRLILSALVLGLSLNFCAAALDLQDINNKLSDVFDSLSDDNAGTTVFRSLNIPTGGRVESLGTSFTGLADDISFFDYNPAASSVLKNTETAFFHNSWIADSAMESLQATTRFNNLGLGAQLKCFYVPFSEYNLYGDKVAASYYSETSFALNASYNFLSGYNFKGIALGFNVRGSWRNMPDYTDNQTDEIKSGSGFSQSALGLMADAGLLMRFNFIKTFNTTDPNLTFGLALNNIGLAFTGLNTEFELDDSLPTRVSVGLSYRLFKPVLFTVEFRKPVNLLDFKSSEMWSLASGAEFNITKFFDFELGFCLQGANPRFSMGSQFDVKGVKMNINYSLDLTSSFNPVNHISLGAKLNLGDKGRSNIQSQVQLRYAEGIELYSKGSRNDIENAIQKWQEAKELSKNIGIRYDPAIEAINTARQLLLIHDEINAFGTLER